MGVTLHFQSTGTIPGSGAPVSMVGPALTVGRGAENDLCLPDPGKVVSKNHCTIEDHGGNAVVIDLSTNGTFLNYGKQPLGPVSTPLNDGDILTIGPYEILVEIVAARRAAAQPMPPAEDPVAPPRVPQAGDDFDDLLGDDPAAGLGGGDDFLDDLLGGGEPLRGPAAVSRPELGDDGLLPPLGEDESGLLDPAPEPDPQGASDSEHSDASRDAFRPSSAMIPDDWGDDLLLPGGEDDDPFAEPPAAAPPPRAIPAIPEDAPLDLAVPAPQAAANPEDDPLGIEAPEIPRNDSPAARGPPLPQRVEIAAVRAAPPAAKPAEPPPAALQETTRSPGPVAAEPVPTPTGGDSAVRAFLAAAGAGDLAIPDSELESTMTRLGGVLQTMIHGMREILMTRASIKSEFRIQQTMIGAGRNNPLKFSISPEQAVEAMVRPRSKGYLQADEAAAQALQDIKAHEVAMMTAMEAALKGVLKQLSPEVLEGQISSGGGFTDLLKGKKARYWEVYEKMYARISDQAETDFHELFSREFARAYQAQLERLK